MESISLHLAVMHLLKLIVVHKANARLPGRDKKAEQGAQK